MGRHSNQMLFISYKEIMPRLNFFFFFGNVVENITLCSHNSIKCMSYHFNITQTIKRRLRLEIRLMRKAKLTLNDNTNGGWKEWRETIRAPKVVDWRWTGAEPPAPGSSHFWRQATSEPRVLVSWYVKWEFYSMGLRGEMKFLENAFR